MTRYEKMCDAARTAARKDDEYRFRCYGVMGTFIKAFVEYCEIPPGQMTFLRWNGAEGDESRYEVPENGGKYSPAGAMTAVSDGFWEMGINLALSDIGYIFFVIGVGEEGGKSLIRVKRSAKPIAFDAADHQSSAKLFDEIVEEVEQTFIGSKKQSSKGIGFMAHLAEPV